MSALDALDALRKGPKEAAVWALAPFSPTYRGEALVLDQSLANTGWAFMQPSHPFVTRTGMVKTEADHSGHDGDLRRAVEIHDALDSLIRELMREGWTNPLIVHESPPIGTLVFGGGTSSLLASLSIRIIASSHGIPVQMVSAQSAKHRLTGNSNAEKRQVAEGIKTLMPHLPTTKPWNEHVRDAVAIGIVALERTT